MTDTLTGKKILTIVTNEGVEQDELVVPVDFLKARGAEMTVAAAEAGPINTLVGDKDPGATQSADTTLATVDDEGYDLLLIPGGTINADTLRLESDAVELVKAFASSGRPIAAICHGPWLLVESGVIAGKTTTSYPSVRTDLLNAGAAQWRDESVVVCDAEGYTLITSRNPGDLDDFTEAIGQALTDA